MNPVTQKHVLVVDDDPLILEVLVRALTSSELRVTTARRVSVAKDILVRQTVDLVIADARIPGETGIQLARAAYDLGIDTIIISGDREWTAEQGIAPEQYLAKPFDLCDLRRMVAARLARRDLQDRALA
jgi:two-component system, OmpR family, response regulator